MFFGGCLQEMVTVETFVEFIRKKDVGRIRFAIRETLYDLDATDEVLQCVSSLSTSVFAMLFLQLI